MPCKQPVDDNYTRTIALEMEARSATMQALADQLAIEYGLTLTPGGVTPDLIKFDPVYAELRLQHQAQFRALQAHNTVVAAARSMTKGWDLTSVTIDAHANHTVRFTADGASLNILFIAEKFAQATLKTDRGVTVDRWCRDPIHVGYICNPRLARAIKTTSLGAQAKKSISRYVS